MILSAFLALALTPARVHADSDSFSKVDFEQRTGVIVWDLGSRRGQVDNEDDLTDLSQACTIIESNKRADPKQIFSAKAAVPPDELKQSVAQTLERLGIGAIDVKMTPVVSSLGNVHEPVFLLFPEIHLDSPISSELGELHLSLAHDLMKVTAMLDIQNTTIVNTAEGAQGTWRPEFELSPKTLLERFKEAYKLMATRWITGSQLVGEIFRDRVTTQYHDNNDLSIEYILSLKAFQMSLEPEASKESRWLRAKAFVEEKFAERANLAKVDGFRDFFDKTSLVSAKHIDAINSQICEARSREMAKYSYDLAKKQGARVVYASFGALHAHGFMEQLRRYSASYIVFSPNF